MNMLTSLKAFLFTTPVKPGAKGEAAPVDGASDFAQLLNAVGVIPSGQAPIAQPVGPVSVIANDMEAIEKNIEAVPSTAQLWQPAVTQATASHIFVAMPGMQEPLSTVSLAVSVAAEDTALTDAISEPATAPAKVHPDRPRTQALPALPTDLSIASDAEEPAPVEDASLVVEKDSEASVQSDAMALESAQTLSANDMAAPRATSVQEQANEDTVSHTAPVFDATATTPDRASKIQSKPAAAPAKVYPDRLQTQASPALPTDLSIASDADKPAFFEEASPVVEDDSDASVQSDAMALGSAQTLPANDMAAPRATSVQEQANEDTVSHTAPVFDATATTPDRASKIQSEPAAAPAKVHPDQPQTPSSSAPQTDLSIISDADEPAPVEDVSPVAQDDGDASVQSGAMAMAAAAQTSSQDKPEVTHTTSSSARDRIAPQSTRSSQDRADRAVMPKATDAPLVDLPPSPSIRPDAARPAPAPAATTPPVVTETIPAVSVAVASSTLPETDVSAEQSSDLAPADAPSTPAKPRAEAVSLLQLVRDHMSLHGPKRSEAAAPGRDVTVDGDPAILPGVIDDATMFATSLVQPTNQPVMTTPTAAIPAVDLSASLGAQIVDIGVSGQWIDGLARDIAGLSANGAQGRFQINTDHLGSVMVDIRQGDDGASVSLTVATEAAEQALRQEGDRLRLDAGLSAARISEMKIERTPNVAETARSDTAGNQSASQQQSGGQGQNSGQNPGHSTGQGMGQSTAQSHMQGRGQHREKIPLGHKAGNDGAVLNHMDAGGIADATVRARYA